MQLNRRTAIIGISLTAATASLSAAAHDDDKSAYAMIVMDPLCLPLSCPCVKGYAQRDYEKLGEYLAGELGRPVEITFHESLSAALKKETGGKADIVIGKHSVVLADAKKSQLDVKPILSLTGKDGLTQMTGLFVVPAADPAVTVADLSGYRIIFGPRECDEKYAAALALLKSNQVALPTEPETCAACSDGATAILELGQNVRAATVISNYAAPLLEGCGTIKKGDLRVIGVTSPVPFVEAFVSQKLPAPEQAAIEAALLKAAARPELLAALETQRGFVPLPPQKS